MNYAKKLWKELKDYFQKLKRKPSSGSEGGKDIVSKWKFLGAMMFFDPFMKHRKTSSSSLDLQSEAEMSPAADEDASDNSSSEVVVANSLLPVVENDEDIDEEDETDIDLTINQRNQPPQPSALPFTTDKPSSSKTPIFGGLQPPPKALRTQYDSDYLHQAKSG